MDNCYDVILWLVTAFLLNFLMKILRKLGICEKLMDKGIGILEFNFYIDFINSNFLCLFAGSSLNLTVYSFSTPGEAFSTILSFLIVAFLFCYILFMIYNLCFRNHNKPNLNNLAIGLREDGRYFHVLKTLRLPLVFLMVMTISERHPHLVHSITLIYLVMPIVIYLLTQRVFTEKSEQRLEVINQLVILWCLINAWPGHVWCGYLIIAGYSVLTLVSIAW